MLKKIHDWLEVRLGIDEFVKGQLTGYNLPRNINAWYSLGSVLLFIFGLQIFTGILLLIYYVPDTDKAFRSVSFIMNQVPFGWLIRLCHAVGSNMMVLVLLLHMFSVMFMGAYKRPRELNWVSGFTLLNLVMVISLTGYLLPWSQLSFWATTIATNSVSAIPLLGTGLVEFMRGGKLVGAATLGRFFTLHVAVLPMIISALAGLHILCVRRTGISSPPFGMKETTVGWTGDRYRHDDHPNGIPFLPDFVVHDLTSIAFYFAIFMAIVFFMPTLFFTADAFMPADPYKTPAHIKPEWYFLANYQTLKVMPNEFLGLALQGIVMTLVALLPFLDRGPERHPLKRPIFMCVAVGSIGLYVGMAIWGHFS